MNVTRKLLLGLVAAGLLVLSPATAVAAPPAGLHCPSGGVKTEVGNHFGPTVTFEEETTFCVKWSTTNSGVLTGTTFTTPDGKDISYYVVYEEDTDGPTPTQSPTPSPTASAETPSPPPPQDTPNPTGAGKAGPPVARVENGPRLAQTGVSDGALGLGLFFLALGFGFTLAARYPGKRR